MRLFLVIFSFAVLFCSCGYKAWKEKRQKWEADAVKYYSENLKSCADIAPKIKVNKGDTVCDIGGGWGMHSAMLANYLPKGVIYFEEDINKKVCNKRAFKATFKTVNPQVDINDYRFFIGTATKTPFRDKFFKTVMVSISIHEFQYKDSMMNEIKRIMKDDGRLYITETVYKNNPAIDSTCKFTYLSEKELYSLISRNGFGIVPHADLNTKDSTDNVVGRYLECYKLQ